MRLIYKACIVFKSKIKRLWFIMWESPHCPTWVTAGGNMIIFTMLLSVAALINHAGGRLALISVILLAALWIVTRDLER
jgi:hypothetical protein